MEAPDDGCEDSSKDKTSSEAWTHDEYSLWVDAIIRINDKSKHAPAVDITEEARSREDELAEKEEIGEEDIDTLSKESEIVEAPDDGCEDSSKDKTSSDAWIPDEECSPADAIIEINEKNEYVSDVDITEGEYAKEAEAEEKEVIGGECIDTLSKESEIAEAPDDGCEDSSKDKTSSEIWIPDEEYSPADAIIEINEKNNYAPDFDKTEGEHSEEDEVAEKEEIGGEDIDTLSTESEIAEAPDENCEDSNEYTIAPEYDVIDSAITHVTSGEVSEDAPAVKNIEDYSSLLGASQIKEEAEVIEICSFDNCFSEINTVIDDYSAMEAELDNGVYGSEDDKYFKNTDEKVIKSIDIESTEEKHPKNEINEKEEHIYAEESSKVPGGDIVSAEPTEETGKKYLVNGFTVEDGKIRNEASQRIIRDAPVEILSLSTWTYNAIYRTKEHIMEAPHEIVMISDLLKLSPEQLRRLHNLGAKSAEEIIERVSAYLCSDMNNEEKNGVDKQYTIAPDYEVIDGIITHTGSGHAVEDVFIDNIGLGVRVTNSLHRRQIMKLSELIFLSVQQLKEFPNMGAKSISEILETVPRYLDANQVTELPTYVPAKVDIPPLDSEYAVLASDYAVANGVIYHRKTLKIIPDISVERLDLSFRALNCLIRNGNDRVSSLVGMPFRDFRSIRNLGQRSANEIQEKLELYLDNSEKQAVLASSVSTEQILSVMHSHEFEPIDLDMILQAVPDATEDGVKTILANLVDSQEIMQDEGTFAIKHVSFFEAVNESFLNNYYQSGDERAARILQQRASGKTLEEVGRQEGMTRERIRQIEQKVFRKLAKRGIIYEEDKYMYLFTTYALEREFYFDYLAVSRNVWYYLNLRYTKGKTEISKALEDERLPLTIRRTIDRYIHRGYIQIDGSYIPMQRSAFEDIVAERYCKDEVPLEAFFRFYKQFLAENGITDDRLQLKENVKSSRVNRLCGSNKILWKQNQRLRYYDIDGGDFTELLETLNLGQYENVELSTRKFLIDYPELMKRYDLRDEYEIHNLLKKIHAEKENPQMVFGRMPDLQFGVFDRQHAVKKMLFALAPISADNLAETISLEYGTRADTIRANWLNCISEYYHQGMYSVEYEDMPEEHVQKLKSALVNDFYFMTELRMIYSNLVTDADLSLLSTYNLKKMGFLVGTSYVIQHYSSADAYFEHLLTSDDVIDIAPISKRYVGLSTYNAYLASIKHEMRIIEFEPYQYINIRRLEKLGITKEKLREYGSQVWSYLIDDRYFTIQSIRSDGFTSELDGLGFGDLFYASLLKEDGRFSWQRVGNAVVFNPKGNSFTVHDFLVDCITDVGSVNIDDFSSGLREKFGIELDRYTINEKVKGGDVYYDSIMEKLYADYSLYFEEI